MTVAPSDFDLQQLWQGQQEVHAPVTLAEIHARALTFRKEAQRRRMFSWAVMAFGALVLVWFAPRVTGWMMQLGAALTALAMILVLWRWQRINAFGPLPGEGEALVQAYRTNLIRVRDARRTVMLWRIAPLLPGLVLVFLGRWFQLHAKGLSLAADHWVLLLTAVVAAVGLFLGYRRNQRHADALQGKIDELDGR